MSQAESQRLVAHVKLIRAIRALIVARDREAERVAMLTIVVAELNAL